VLQAETGVTVNLAPITINALNPANSGFSAIPTHVSFGNDVSGSTITLTNGESWAALGYVPGGGIFVGSPDNLDANGSTFDPTAAHPYYTIAAISGATLTLNEHLATAETGATVNLSPVKISGLNGASSTLTGVSTRSKVLTSIASTDPAHGGDDTISGQWVAGTSVPTSVTFGNSGGAGTITLTSGTWQAAGYTVGAGIYVQGNGTNGNGTSFTGDNYYTIAAINGSVLTLKGQILTAASGVANLSPVQPTPAGAGNNIIIGGSGSDTIDIGGASNTVVGDMARRCTTGRRVSLLPSPH
jgi:hypothetical protein